MYFDLSNTRVFTFTRSKELVWPIYSGEGARSVVLHNSQTINVINPVYFYMSTYIGRSKLLHVTFKCGSLFVVAL